MPDDRPSWLKDVLLTMVRERQHLLDLDGPVTRCASCRTPWPCAAERRAEQAVELPEYPSI